MSNFFCKLVDIQLIEKWAYTLDWLFDDNKFSKVIGWNTGHVSAFTKAIKRLPHFSINNYYYVKRDTIIFPKSGDRFHTPTFYMKKGDSEGKDLVRHIRNGIAHGRTNFYTVKSELYIEICDFGKEGNGYVNKQTAFLAMPMSYIQDICKLYMDREKAIKNNKMPMQRKKDKANGM